jgi:hypothetical protein
MGTTIHKFATENCATGSCQGLNPGTVPAVVTFHPSASFRGHGPSYNLGRVLCPNRVDARADNEGLPSIRQNNCVHRNEGQPTALPHMVVESNNLHASGNVLS